MDKEFTPQWLNSFINDSFNKINNVSMPIVISNYSYNYFIFSRHYTKEIRRVIRDAKHLYRNRKKYKRMRIFIDDCMKNMLSESETEGNVNNDL